MAQVLPVRSAIHHKGYMTSKEQVPRQKQMPETDPELDQYYAYSSEEEDEEYDENLIERRKDACYKLALSAVQSFCSDISTSTPTDSSSDHAPLPQNAVTEIRSTLSQIHALRPSPINLQVSYSTTSHGSSMDSVASAATKKDCLISFYLSLLNRRLGRMNSAHYYRQETLTLVETSQLLKVDKNENNAGSHVDAVSVLDAWIAEEKL